eukprot:scaffold19556_cov37-Phaeocystis_antarctica.AAC.2
MGSPSALPRLRGSAGYYIKVVGSRVAGNLNIRDADRKALDIAVEPKFLSRRPLVSTSVSVSV